VDLHQAVLVVVAVRRDLTGCHERRGRKRIAAPQDRDRAVRILDLDQTVVVADRADHLDVVPGADERGRDAGLEDVDAALAVGDLELDICACSLPEV